jgi:hypothetical protein
MTRKLRILSFALAAAAAPYDPNLLAALTAASRRAAR